MIAACKVLQFGYWNQYAAANSSRREVLVSNQVIQSALTDGEHLRCFLAADQQFIVGGNSGSSWWLFECAIDLPHGFPCFN